MNADNCFVIVGAGVAGLTLAYLLAGEGRRVIVLERDVVAGGLAKSYRYGDYLFDVGPHRFYTEEAEVTAFIDEILGDDKLVIPRSSAVFMSGRFIEWPLTLSALFSIHPRLLLKSLRDMLGRKAGSAVTFEEYIIGRYGRTLYEIFFKPYTEKFLGITCSETAREWAMAGIDRATIDSSVGVDSLFSLAGSMLRRRDPLKFIYPRSGGISVFVDSLVAGIRNRGGEVLLDSEVLGLEMKSGLVTSVRTATRSFPCTQVVWTGPLQALAASLGCAPPSLEYLSLLLFNYRLTSECVVPYQWCYFGEGDIPFNRISFPTMFNRRLAPRGCSGISVEVTCRVGDQLWSDHLSREDAIRKTLLRYGLIPSPEAVAGVVVEKVADAYPVYRTGFQEKVERFIRTLPAANLITAGRTGGFWYNNMDNSISEALQIAARLGPKGRSHA